MLRFSQVERLPLGIVIRRVDCDLSASKKNGQELVTYTSYQENMATLSERAVAPDKGLWTLAQC